MDSFGRKEDPLAVMLVLGPPAAMSSTMLAPSGVGTGVGVGLAAAMSANQAGTMTRTLSDLTRRPKVTSDRRPGDRPGGGRLGKSPARIHHTAEPPAQHLHLCRVEQPVERSGELS